MIRDRKPFSQVALNEIFKTSQKDPDILISRENNTLEFKESFGWASMPKYSKSCVAFANNKGGYIVFGVKNSPHKLKGLSGKALDRFQEIDPDQFSNHFNTHFSPELEWDLHEYELEGKFFGLLYVYESRNKPVLCTKNNGDDLKEGDIYYRYRGRSERIKYPELQNILDARREREQKLWMRHLANIAKIGVRDAGVFDFHSGKVSGAGGAFFIDESLLSQLAFIKEGEFSEKKGRPTLKLIGNLESVSKGDVNVVGRRIIRTKGVRTADIILGMLDQESVHTPEEYIKQICFESTAFLPVYYYINKARLTTEQAISTLEATVARSSAKSKLIERLRGNTSQAIELSGANTPAANEKAQFADKLRQKKVDITLSGKSLERCLQAIRGLSVKEIQSHSKYVRGLLKGWFNKYYATADGSIADNLRRAICWVDEALYCNLEKGNV